MGDNEAYFGAIRFNSDGSLDNTFGTSGTAIAPAGIVRSLADAER